MSLCQTIYATNLARLSRYAIIFTETATAGRFNSKSDTQQSSHSPVRVITLPHRPYPYHIPGVRSYVHSRMDAAMDTFIDLWNGSKRIQGICQQDM
jgi:hypothetical protein